LRGEWSALNTPAHKVPSHGTDYLAQTYAYDFARFSWKAGKVDDFHGKKSIDYLLGRVKLHDCYGWSQPVMAPFAGTVVHASDGWPERRTVHIVSDVFIALKNGLFFNEKKHEDLGALAGNYLILEGANCFAFLAHLKTGSIAVKKGGKVAAGHLLGEVGHSGNSTAPHLHFHLMDAPDPRFASGVPCSFDNYEVYRDGAWVTVHQGMPGRLERIRMCA
jgi:hypothetical protein